MTRNSVVNSNPNNKSRSLLKLIPLFALSSMFIGCGGSNDAVVEEPIEPPVPIVTIDDKVRVLIAENELTGDPTIGRVLPNIEDPKAQLGMKLFFTKSLGGDHDSACVTCHHPTLGGGDDLALPVGVDGEMDDLLGPGRFHSISGDHFDGGPTVPRNAPTTFNLALWDSVLFHDGRVQSLGATPLKGGDDGLGIRTPDAPFGIADANAGKNLAVAQARFPVTSPEEMKNFGNLDGTNNAEVRQNLEQRIGGYGAPLGGALAVNNWLVEFRAAFDNLAGTAEELVTFDNITEAIAEYENSQILVDTPWKAYVAGDNTAISYSAKRGALIFFNSIEDGGADCASCHSGDFFTDEEFYAIGMPQIGRGKGNGDDLTDDFGRFRETGNEDDRYAFRTPSLINTTATGPWGHAGASATLEHAIRHHLDPQVSLDNYDFSQLAPNIQATNLIANTQKAIDKLVANRAAGLESIQNVVLSDIQVADLLEFMGALTDPCVEDRSCLAKWIPDASDSNPDTLRLNAIDFNGNYL